MIDERNLVFELGYRRFRHDNRASYLIPLTVRFMANRRDDDLETLCAALSANATALFGIGEVSA